MTQLVLCVSDDERAWPHLYRLILEGEWSAIYAIGPASSRRKFHPQKSITFITADFAAPVGEIVESLKKQLAAAFTDFEIALNLVSGSGKEHMAILAALLKAGVGIRLVAVTHEGVREL